MPGKISIKKNQYYANRRNQFWKIIEKLFNVKLSEDYSTRLAFLLDQRIGLWDVIKSCEREGSLDSDIRKPLMNDFDRFFKEYPGIKTVFFNGGKAYNIFVRNINKELSYQNLIKLPSTSPAHAVSLDEKLKQWESVNYYLQ